jgi:hypothetical protein
LLEREKKRERGGLLTEIFFLLLCCSAGYEESERERVYMGRRWGVEEEGVTGVAWKARRVHCCGVCALCSVIKVQRFNASGV